MRCTRACGAGRHRAGGQPSYADDVRRLFLHDKVLTVSARSEP